MASSRRWVAWLIKLIPLSKRQNQMQFKKHFSSNLQSLSAKQTVVLQAPPHLEPSLFSPSHRHAASALAQLPSDNKENSCLNARSPERPKELPRKQNSPVLTFHNIKLNMLDNQRPSSRKALLPDQKTKPRTLTKGSPSLQQSNSFGSIPKLSHASSNASLRLGSMVFAPEESRRTQIGDSGRASWRQRGRGFTERERVHLQCSNQDGQPAKYKLPQSNNSCPDHEDPLYYCFSCAIPLLKQDFPVQQLTPQDRLILQQQSEARPEPKGRRNSGRQLKLGEQIKCKIIPRINRAKLGKEEFSRATEANLDSIGYYYASLIGHIEQQKARDLQQYARLARARRIGPEQYEQQLNCALGNIDYLLRHPHGISPQTLHQAQLSVQAEEVPYPSQPAVEPHQGFSQRITAFCHLFDQQFKLQLDGPQEVKRHSRRHTFDCDSSRQRTSARFSFESALEDSRREQPQRWVKGGFEMNPLEEENQSEQESLGEAVKPKDAFRNLFPEGDELCDSIGKSQLSPVFKEF